MNSFYTQPKALQWIEAILLLPVGFLPVIGIIEVGYEKPLLYLLLVFYVPMAQFACTPIFKLTGVYTYYSPMLLGYMANDKQIDLHSGSSFDYLFVMRKFKPGNEIRNQLLIFHLEGLINIIKLMEDKKIPERVTITGTSYFFNHRTLHKIGFEMLTPSLFYRLNLFINTIDLIWMYSLSQGKWAMPKIWNAQKAGISGTKLMERKEVIEELYSKMKSRTSA